jgi:hypothetical protein
MKFSVLLAALLLFMASTGFAQENNDQNNQPGARLEAVKIGWLTNKLNLSPEEAQRFWPIYEQYSREIRDARLANKNKTDIELDEIVLNIRKKYNNQFANALPSGKVNQFFRSEREFNNYVRREWMERAPQRRLQQQRMMQQRRAFGNRP